MTDPYSKTQRSDVTLRLDSRVTSYTSLAPTPVVSSSNISQTWPAFDTFNGEKLSNWKRIVREGMDATTPASGVKYSSHSEYLSAGNEVLYTDQSFFPFRDTYKKAEQYGYYPYGGFPSTGAPPGSAVTEARNRCVAKFLSRVRAVTSSIEAGQDLGELKESLHALINPLGSLREHVLTYFTSLKKAKRKWRKVGDLRRAVADTYLEWTFGWNPLVSDIAEAYVGLQNASERFAIVPVEAHSSNVFSSSDSTGSFSSDGSCVVRYHLVSSSKFSVRIKGAVKTGCVNGALPKADLLQLTPKDFFPTAWDLLPFSFIADYFANIGDIINAASLLGTNYVFTCKTERTVSRRDYFVTGCDKLNVVAPQRMIQINDNWCQGGNAWFQTKSFSRTRLNSEDLLPVLRFRIPTSKRPWENLSAIMAANVRSLVPLWPPGTTHVRIPGR